MGEAYADVSGLADLKRANLAGSLDAARQGEFTELLAAEALIAAHVFANAAAYLLAPHGSETQAEVGEAEELLTDNAPLALHGALWELDQKLALHAPDDAHLIAGCGGLCRAADGEGGLARPECPKAGGVHGCGVAGGGG